MTETTHQERLMTVLQGPHLSEKSHLAAESNQVVFKVRPDANKTEIKQAVELLFEVSVTDVTVINYAGKIKRHGTSSGRRAAWKKAYVRLAEGSHIDFLEAD
jgi:large subunit ribosomal protein L23